MGDNDGAPEEGELVGEVTQTTESRKRRTRYDNSSIRARQYGDRVENGFEDEDRREVEESGDYEERILAALEGQNEDEDRVIEESRKRRREILKKHGIDLAKATPREPEPVYEDVEYQQHHAEEDNLGRDCSVEQVENTITNAGKDEEHGNDAKRESLQSEEGDMFADTPENESTEKQNGTSGAQPNAKGLSDNYDDAEGYYNFQVGELLANRYKVFATHGRGVFSSVLRARDVSDASLDQDMCPQVAVKVIRANDTMYKAGKMERVILKKLSQADPQGNKHCVKMLDSFEYRNHLCLVFEPMDMNLRDLTKKYGRGIGLHINAVKVYAAQMFIALLHLQNCGVLHADIKPDNILVNESRTTIKICDFGSAMFSGDNEITPYLVSRFYRSPEVILGLPYDHPMDMWSIGCVIYELFTGQILFKGRTNNEMLKLMMDIKGPFPKKMVKKAEFAFKHFDLNDATMSFSLEEEDLVTKQPIRRNISNPVKKLGFSKLLSTHSDNKKKVAQLVDLLERIFALEPEKRITPLQALTHPFIKEQETKNPNLSHAPRSLQRSRQP